MERHLRLLSVYGGIKMYSYGGYRHFHIPDKYLEYDSVRDNGVDGDFKHDDDCQCHFHIHTTAWNTIKTTVTTIANAIWNITTAFNNMLSATGTVNNIRGAIQNGFESARTISNLASQAYNWGRDIIRIS